jgi:hypothetical protein
MLTRHNRFVFIAICSLLAPACGLYAGTVIETVQNGPNGPHKSAQVFAGQVRTVQFVSGGKVVASSTLEEDASNVIIQMVERPALSARVLSARRSYARESVKARINAREGARRSLAADGAVIRHEYGVVFNGIAARLHRDTIEEIRQMPEVARIWPDRRVRALSDEAALDRIGAKRVWSELGATGRGVQSGGRS